MGNIIDYIREYGHELFEERPFSAEDSLVLAQFAYLKLDGAVPSVREGGRTINLSEVKRRKPDREIFADTRYEEENRALLDALTESRRFGSLGLNYHENHIDREREYQFCAVTCFLDNGLVYLAFRGTDESIVGWKEDFNMAFRPPVPGQLLSVSYVNRVAELLGMQGGGSADDAKAGRRLMLGGHSKGGNFAVYAAMNCDRNVQDEILSVYSHDGPGFRPEIFESDAFARIRSRIVKIIPHSSVVGMLFDNHEPYQVVESSTFGILQHDPFTWELRGGHFIKVKDLYKGRKISNEVLNRWIMSLDEEQLENFVESLFEAVNASRAETLPEFTEQWFQNSLRIMQAFRGMDKETKRQMRKTMAALLRAVSEILSERRKGKNEEHEQFRRGYGNGTDNTFD